MSGGDRAPGGPTAFQRAARRARDRILRAARDSRGPAARPHPDAGGPPTPAGAPPGNVSAAGVAEPDGARPDVIATGRPPVALATGLEPDLAEPPEIDFDAPGPPRITGRTVPPPETLHPPEPEDGEIEIRPLTAELGIHVESIPPPHRAEASPDRVDGEPAPYRGKAAPDGPDQSPPPPPAARWTGFAESFEQRPDDLDAAGDLPTDPSLELETAAEPVAAAEPIPAGPAPADSAPADPAPAQPTPATGPPYAHPPRAPVGVDGDWTLIPPPGSRTPTAIAAGMLFLGGLGAGIAATLLVTENDGAPASAPSAAAVKPAPLRAAAAPAAAPVPLLPRAFAIDPYGGDGEHQEQARLAVDGDTASGWTTQRYAAGTLGKPGVGLAVTAVRPATARRITIRTPTPGFRAEIYGAAGGRPAPGAPRAGWVRLAGASTVRSGVPIRLAPAAPMRHWLVWIVALAPGRKSAEIAEIGLRR